MLTRKYSATQWSSPSPQQYGLFARLAIAAAASFIVSGAALAAGAVSSDGYRFVGGEIGYVYEGTPASSQAAREQRRQDDIRTSDGYRFVGGEAGYVYAGPAPLLGSGTGARIGVLTRAQVQRELMEFKRNPISADGQWRYVGGEQGWARR